MKLGFFNSEHIKTPYVQLDTQKCKACWNCIAICPNQVIGKVDLAWHKHALIIKGDNCTGCQECFNACQYDVYTIIDKEKQETEKQRRRVFNSFLFNNLLLISCIVMILSGVILQLGFHIGGSDEHQIRGHGVQYQSMQDEHIRRIDLSNVVFGLNYTDWSTTHKFAIVIFSLLMTYHFYAHWKWYRAIITKHLIRKNIQSITISVLFLLVALTGLVPWFIDLSGSTSALRLLFIEIHDKLALILVIYLILHVVRRNQWFLITYAKLKKQYIAHKTY